MSSVEAQGGGPCELAVALADRRSRVVVLPLIAACVEHSSDGCRCGRDTIVRDRGVLGESFQVDRGAAEQELYVGGGGAGAADAVESVDVLQLRDHAFGVRHPSPGGPDA